jgi:hypothetical protein
VFQLQTTLPLLQPLQQQLAGEHQPVLLVLLLLSLLLLLLLPARSSILQEHCQVGSCDPTLTGCEQMQHCCC